MIRVVYIITELSVGGAQQALFRLLEQTDRNVYDPTVVCLYNGDGEVAQAIRDLEVPVKDLKLKRLGIGVRLWRFWRFLRQNKPHLVHTFLFHANFLGRILGRLAGSPIVICSERTMAMESDTRYRLNRWTLFLVDRVTAVSEQVARFAVEKIKVPAEKIVTIPNGINIKKYDIDARQQLRQELSISSDAVVLGAVSRLDPIKGIDDLLHAVQQLPDVHVIIAGDGAERQKLRQLSDRLDLLGRVHWLGYRADIPELLSMMDIFVQPSLHEGMPNTVLEAMASSLPIVATAVGGTPEIVIDGVTGFLIPAQDVRQLIEKVQILLNDPPLRTKMGMAGQDFVAQNFSMQKTVAATEQLYRQLISTKHVSTQA